MIDCPDWLPENLSEITKKVGLTKPREQVYSKAITQLRQDWLSDNADEREEGVTRKELEQKIQEALERCRSLTNPGTWRHLVCCFLQLVAQTGRVVCKTSRDLTAAV